MTYFYVLIAALISMDSLATAYQSLYEQLQHIHQQVLAQPLEKKGLMTDGQQLLQLWQNNLAMVQGEQLSEAALNQWRSLHTEIHRELRLLNVDLMFLGRSNSSTTQTAKQKNVGDRLAKLLQYCTQIQQVITSGDPHKPEA
ncbi:hypothetical protein Lepto7376_1966 [[Leptolyngbya] sp. PCC 7376]|uniref:heterocyst frequency control protein PatD n=1 Tax=[Leptolyngbya] sp. PCC 7376 TaxID=111781 RepID=UPI00029EF13A|nr:heterocyst frequency control protein PatD [[Leptolyngbya] sp. PCC 7376]AFY38276.1 hypothetical protein Lepto7376_1966 [[Leptolyngbya] sp. PCC 7376]